jgi:N-acetylmuramic acid 6-phosphate etherase
MDSELAAEPVIGPAEGRTRWRRPGITSHDSKLKNVELNEAVEDVMLTEKISPRYVELDSWSSGEMIAAMYESQLAAAAAVQGALPAITAAVDEAVPALRKGGRIVYVGAGTSGRIGVQDGSELPPTYSWPADRVVFAMAGGLGALVQSAEQAEDDEATGARAMAEAKIGPDDVVIGIAASGTTPYTIGALRAATAAGAVTVAVANNPGAPLLDAAVHKILVESGAEVIAGSTRMKAGTAQKIVLNLFSTAVMVKLNRVYRGLMVHMRARNAKLLRRAERIVGEIVGCSAVDAARFVEQADGDVKIAVLLGFGLGPAEAAKVLTRHDDNLRLAIGEVVHERQILSR